MFFRSFLRRDFRTQRIQEVCTSLTRKKEEFDHVAIDLGDLIANAYRAKEFRNLVGSDRFEPMYKHVQNNLTNILRKIHARKSLVFLLDGTEGMWKCRKYRKRMTKKQDGYTQRTAGSPLVFAIEDRLQCALLTRQSPSELLFSGTMTPGCAESKMVSWALDLAARTDVSKNESICLIGSTQLFMTAVGITPFLNITCLKFDMGEFRMYTLPAVLEWLDLNRFMENGELGALSRIRTDVVLLLLFLEGWSVSEVGDVSGMDAKDLLQAYHNVCVSEKVYLFEEEPGRVGLDVALLTKLLLRVNKARQQKARQSSAEDYLEIVLQAHHMLTVGGISNQMYSLPTKADPEKALNLVTADSLYSQLKLLKTSRLYCTSSSERLNPLEYFLTTLNTELQLSEALKTYAPSKFYKYNTGTVEKLINIEDTFDALNDARNMLKDLRTRHKALKEAPTHMWMRVSGAMGPPPGYVYFACDLGGLARRHDVRINAAAGKGFEDTKMVKGNTPRLIGYDASQTIWEAYEAAKTLPENQSDFPQFRELKIVTWNVQFSRFSGQKTPLGRPGIDWCSDTRYIALSKILSDTDADIIAMQECESPWWRYLTSQNWVRKHYYLSSAEDGDCLSPWGNLVLINRRLPISALQHVNLPGFAGHRSIAPIITIQMTPTRALHIICIHLMAPFTTENEDNRKTQVTNLIRRLENRYHQQEFILLGDFNDYPTNMLSFPPSLGLKDAWVEAHGDDPDTQADAYTINGDRNKYTSLIIEPDFFGRADRIYFRAPTLSASASELVGRRDVRTELCITTCPEYLFPSDHFGVLSTFAVNSK